MNAQSNLRRGFQPRPYATLASPAAAAASSVSHHLAKKTGGPSGTLVTIGVVLALGVPIYSTVRSSSPSPSSSTSLFTSHRRHPAFGDSHARISRAVCLENDYASYWREDALEPGSGKGGHLNPTTTASSAVPASSPSPTAASLHARSARQLQTHGQPTLTSDGDMDPFALFVSEYV